MAPALLQANPYRLVEAIPAIGFKAADRIARQRGTPPGAPTRLHAGIEAALREAASDGHTYLPYTELLQRAEYLLGTNLAVPIEAAVSQWLVSERLLAPPPRNPRSLLKPSPHSFNAIRGESCAYSQPLRRLPWSRRPRSICQRTGIRK